MKQLIIAKYEQEKKLKSCNKDYLRWLLAKSAKYIT